MFAVLDDVGEALITLAAFTGRLEQVLKLRVLHVLGATANFGGKDSVELFALSQGPGGEHSYSELPTWCSGLAIW